MAQKYKMQQGKLDKLLRESGKTRDDIQNQPGAERDKRFLDRKTVIAINKGEEASIRSFEKIANILNLKLSDLITELSNEDRTLYFDSLYSKFPKTVKADKPDGANLVSLIKRAGKLLYNLDVKNLDTSRKSCAQAFDTLIKSIPHRPSPARGVFAHPQKYSYSYIMNGTTAFGHAVGFNYVRHLLGTLMPALSLLGAQPSIYGGPLYAICNTPQPGICDIAPAWVRSYASQTPWSHARRAPG